MKEGAAYGGELLDWIKKRTTETVFLDLLEKATKEGRYVSESKNAGNYAPRAFARRPDNENRKTSDFETAMENLFAQGRIKMTPEGKRPRRVVAAEGVHGVP